jgi:hypothetical protein
MSWSGWGDVPKDSNVVEVVEAVEAITVSGNDHAPDEKQEQVAFAKQVVATAIKSGVIGNTADGKFRVNISGHANVGHKTCPEWADDAVSISIQQMVKYPDA